MEFKVFESKYFVTVVILFVCFCEIHCVPVEVKLATSTPKVYKDRFQINKETRPIQSNTSFGEKMQGAFGPGFMMDAQNRRTEFENPKSLDNVKAVNLGEKTMKECDKGDDDYDDGEYAGLDGNSGSAGKKNKESVPMLLIHEMDMVALEIPVKGKDKNDKSKEQTHSSCNNNVGAEPYQTHWKPKPPSGNTKVEQKMRPGYGRKSFHENAFGIGGRSDGVYDMEDEGDEVEQGMGGKRNVPYGLADRRDMPYVLEEKRESPYETRQRSKGFKYF